MPRISTTTRIAAAASIATALAVPGIAGAIEIASPLPGDPLEAVKEDVAQLGSTVQQAADQIAPNTREYVKNTARQTGRSAEHAVQRTSDFGSRTVVYTRRTASGVATRAAAHVVQTSGNAQRTARRTRQDAQRRADRARTGSVQATQPVLGCWTFTWSTDLRNIAASMQAGC